MRSAPAPVPIPVPVLVLVLVLVLVPVPVPVPAAPQPACLPAAPQPGPGATDPFRAPDPKATELNTAAKTLYRQGKWEEARAQYRAAHAADPDFLAPRLNIACSFVRQDRFQEATAEVLGLLDRAYVPWAREVLEAADLGALKVRPEMARIRQAMADAAFRWGEGLDASVLFVARQRPPLRVPAEGAGVFILNPHQEVWAFSPRTRRYRQITVEDGHVLALARSPDGRRIAYVTAEKLVRGAAAGDVALRGVALHELTLATMGAEAAARIDGDVRRLEISGRFGRFAYRIERDKGTGTYEIGPDGEPLSASRPLGPPLVVLTGRGVTAPSPKGTTTKTNTTAPRGGGGDCGVVARAIQGPDGVPAISLVAAGRRPGKPLMLESGAGAALAGLPIP